MGNVQGLEGRLSGTISLLIANIPRMEGENLK